MYCAHTKRNAEQYFQVAEAEKEGAVQRVLAQGRQRELDLLQPQLQHLQEQVSQIKQHVRRIGRELMDYVETLQAVMPADSAMRSRLMLLSV